MLRALRNCIGCKPRLNVSVTCGQSTSVQLKMTTDRLRDMEFENEIMEQRLIKVLIAAYLVFDDDDRPLYHGRILFFER